ncbi:hypothetical protein LINPERPRIM_LOCUS23949, partial [Linum perenne]
IHLSPRCPILTHYLYADDTTIFCEAFIQKADNIMKIISEYGIITGQVVNLDKSSIFFSANVPYETRSKIISRSMVSNTINHSKYLGGAHGMGTVQERELQLHN